MSASFDTNIVIYAFTAGPKQGAARSAMEDGGVISVQVLNEFVTRGTDLSLSNGWADYGTGEKLCRCRDKVMSRTRDLFVNLGRSLLDTVHSVRKTLTANEITHPDSRGSANGYPCS